MPLPPFHLAPGVTLKLVSGRYFSLTIFTFSQIVMDIEPLIRILLNSERLHGFTNTILGASLIGILSIWPGKFICEFCHKTWNTLLTEKRHWLRVNADIHWKAAVYGSITGVYLHFILDAVMHWDVDPFGPLSRNNPFFGVMSLEKLHQGLIGIGILSLLCFIFVWFKTKFFLKEIVTDTKNP